MINWIMDVGPAAVWQLQDQALPLSRVLPSSAEGGKSCIYQIDRRLASLFGYGVFQFREDFSGSLGVHQLCHFVLKTFLDKTRSWKLK